MKHLILTTALLLGISISSSAQSNTATTSVVKPKMDLKDHVCSDVCHKEGHCVYIHGEKGHKCSKECDSMHKETMNKEMKSHKCTSACHDAGHCVYAHGEKGHKCTDACK